MQQRLRLFQKGTQLLGALLLNLQSVGGGKIESYWFILSMRANRRDYISVHVRVRMCAWRAWVRACTLCVCLHVRVSVGMMKAKTRADANCSWVEESSASTPLLMSSVLYYVLHMHVCVCLCARVCFNNIIKSKYQRWCKLQLSRREQRVGVAASALARLQLFQPLCEERLQLRENKRMKKHLKMKKKKMKNEVETLWIKNIKLR